MKGDVCVHVRVPGTSSLVPVHLPSPFITGHTFSGWWTCSKLHCTRGRQLWERGGRSEEGGVRREEGGVRREEGGVRSEERGGKNHARQK